MNLPLKDIDALFSEWDRDDSPGCALGIVRAGEILYQRGYGRADLEHDIPIDARSIFDIGSTSKQFTASCVLLLAREGRLSLEDDVRKYVPSLPEYRRPIEVRHLIHHSSGIRDYINLTLLSGRPITNDYSEDEIVALLGRQRGLEFRTGSQFGYSNSGYLLLGEIVLAVSGMTLREFAEERIFGPLGMSSTFFHDDFTEIVKNRAFGYRPVPNGGGYRLDVPIWDVVGVGAVFTNIEDLTIWDRQFYDYKLPGGEEFIMQLTTPAKLDRKTRSQSNYAFGLIAAEYRGAKTVSHGGSWGGYRAEALRFPEHKMSFIVLANLGTIGASELAYRMADIVLADELEAEASEDSPNQEGSFEADVSSWRGFYKDKKAQLIGDLDIDGEGPLLRIFGQSLRLQGVAPNTLKFDDFPGEVELAGDNELRLQIGRQRRISLKKLEEALPSDDELEALVGSYYSRELDTTYTIELEGGALRLRRAWMPWEKIVPAGGDLFSAGLSVIEFRRRSGRPTGFKLRMSRVGTISFLRNRRESFGPS